MPVLWVGALAVCGGFVWAGLSGIVPTYAIIVREHFAPQDAGSRVGMVIMATLLGMALGGWMSGWVFDMTGSYDAAFVNGIGWNLLNLAIVSWLFSRVRALEGRHLGQGRLGAVRAAARWLSGTPADRAASRTRVPPSRRR